MYTRAMTLHGRLSLARWKRFLVECAEALGMAPVGDPAVWHYPVGGKGGTGTTIVQPITESFLALDTWPDHDGAYLFIASCKSFFPAQLRETIARFELDEDEIGEPQTLHLRTA